MLYIIGPQRNAIKTTMREFPCGPVVKNPPSNAGDVGSIPGWGTKIPHAGGATKPARRN